MAESANEIYERARKYVVMIATAAGDEALVRVAAEEVGTDPREWVRVALLACGMLAGAVGAYCEEIGMDPARGLQELATAELF